MILAAPPQGDGLQDITITDPASGAFSTMTDVLTQGAGPTDEILLLQGFNTRTALGTQAPNPVRVQAVAPDGMTPVSGATVGWSTTNGAVLSACGGAPSCSIVTDESGTASTWVTPGIIGTATVTATLAPGVYSFPPSVTATLTGTSSASDIGVMAAFFYVAQGATMIVPLTARVLDNGSPQNGVTVDFTVVQGPGNLSSASAVTNSTGYTSDTLTLTQFSGTTQVTACVAPAKSPCQTFSASSVPASAQNLQPVAGTAQIVTIGQPFQPLTVRVTDSSTPPNPVWGATVGFQSIVARPAANALTGTFGETNPTQPGMPVILSSSQSSVQSDASGLASLVPSVGSFTGQLEVEITTTAGTSAELQFALEAWPAP